MQPQRALAVVRITIRDTVLTISLLLQTDEKGSDANIPRLTQVLHPRLITPAIFITCFITCETSNDFLQPLVVFSFHGDTSQIVIAKYPVK